MAAISQMSYSDALSWKKKKYIMILISLKLVLIDNKSALVQVMFWRQTGDKPLLEPVLTIRIHAPRGGDGLMAYMIGKDEAGWDDEINEMRWDKIRCIEFLSTYKQATLGVIHYSDVIIGAIASQITSLSIVNLTVYSGTDQRKHQSSPSLAFARGIHLWPVNSLHKGNAVTRKMFPFDDVIMW